MARATPADRLRRILDAIAEIEGSAAGRTFDDYLADAMLRRAVERFLEIISEASRHIPPEAKARHPGIPWRGVADFGNVLRHGYEQVIDARVWEVVTRDLAPLKAAAEAMLREVGADESG
jgi:uncharacterized protein with HEPN domain